MSNRLRPYDGSSDSAARSERFPLLNLGRSHARIFVDGLRAIVEDLGSKNGTSIGGRRLRAPRELMSGDQLLFGSVPAKFFLLSILPSDGNLPPMTTVKRILFLP